MKASELIEKLLELTQEYGQDLEVVYDGDVMDSFYPIDEVQFLADDDNVMILIE